MKNIMIFGLMLCATILAAQTAKKQQPTATTTEAPIVAKTPPMGWNSYNCFGATVREDEVRANAEFMAKNLSQFGWEYIVIDFCWFYPHHPLSKQDNPPQFRLPKDGAYVPWLAMDGYCRLLPDPGKFPSAAQGAGFKPLADYVHSLGLKFGIHIMRGIPRQAVWEKTRVKGVPGTDASMIADTTSKCVWLNNMYGLNMKKIGAQEYLNSLFEMYAEWGVDFVKIDDLGNPYYNGEIEGYRKAIEKCGRPMVLSTSPGATPIEQADHIKKYANQWRLSGDFWDNWKQLEEMFALANQWSTHRSPGHWPDFDMLQLGRLSRRGPVGDERESNFTPDEQLTHMTLWCIGRSPLFIGSDLTVSGENTLKLFSNPEVLAVNQQSTGNRQLENKNGLIIWVADVPGTKEKYVAFFNTTGSRTTMSVNLALLGFKTGVTVRDLWAKEDIGQYKNSYTSLINSHGCGFYRIKAQ
jgi:hypothetical protein